MRAIGNASTNLYTQKLFFTHPSRYKQMKTYFTTVSGLCFIQSYYYFVKVVKGDGISFEVIDPKGISLISLTNEQSGSHQLQRAEVSGDYAICLDNTYSHMTSKLVSLFILTFQSNLMQKKMVEDQMLNETHNAVMVSFRK